MYHICFGRNTIAMSSRIIFIVTLLLCVFMSSLGASDVIVSVNGKTFAEYSYSALNELSYPIPSNNRFTVLCAQKDFLSESNSICMGITLDELLPIMVEAWELKVTNQDGTGKLFSDTNLAESLSFIALITGVEKTTASGVVSPQGGVKIEITGEVSQEKDMEVWISWEGVPELKIELERFAKLHNVVIKALEVPKISSKLIQTQRGGGKVPDLVMVQSDYVFDLIVADAIQPLDYMDYEHLGDSGIQSFKLFDRQWAIPFYFDSQVIICNSGLMAKVGVNPTNIKTLDDLERAGDAIKNLDMESPSPQNVSSNIVPISWNLYSTYWLLPFQYGFGKTRLIEDDGTVQVNDKPTIDSVEYLLTLIDRGIVSANERDAMLANFVAGRTAIILSASYMIPELTRINFPFEVISFPMNQETGKMVAPILDYKGFSITKRSRNPILARRLIQYLCGLGVQQRFPLKMDKLPAWELAMDMESWESNTRKAVKASAVGGYEIPPDMAYRIYKNVLWSMLRLILDRKLSVEQGLGEAQRLIDIQVSEQLTQLPEGYRYKTIQGGSENETNSDGSKVQGIGVNDDADSGGGFFHWLRKFW